jgi:adenylate kinase family enzyme
MQRVVLFGPGGSGKTTMGRRLSTIIGVAFVELDKNFWDAQLPKQRLEWIESQNLLLAEDAWILDGDLGPYDAPEVRIAAADTAIVLDLPRWLCL